MAEELKVPYTEKGFNFDKTVDKNFVIRNLEKEKKDLIIQNEAPGKPTILSFGGCGVQEETGEAFYGWSKAIYDFPQYTHISVRDSFHCWYFNGIRGVSTNIEGTIDYLFGITQDAPMLVTCGTSGGAYAALLYGNFLGADHILALAPQTILEDGIKSQADGHMYRVYAALERRPHHDKYRDLRNFPLTGVDAEIVYSPEEEVDTFHALRMQDMPGVRYTLSRGTHGEVAKYFRDDGHLYKKLQSYL